MLKREEGQRFEQIIEDFDIAASNMLGAYDFYQVMGLPAFSKYSEKNFQDRFQYLTIECKFRKNVLDAGLACISAAKTVLSKEQLKNDYDEKLRRKFKNQKANSNIEVEELEEQIEELDDQIEELEDKNKRLSEDNKRWERINATLKDEKLRLAIDNRSKTYSLEGLRKDNSILNSEVRKKNLHFWGLFLILISLLGFWLYKEVYVSHINSNYVFQTNLAFTNYLDSIPDIKCEKENTKVRNVILNDVNHDGDLEGIVIATFNGIDCKNSFEQRIFIYDLKSKYFAPQLGYSLSRTNKGYLMNENHFSYRGIENDTITFDRWKLNVYNQRSYNGETVNNSYAKVLTFINGDTLYQVPR